MKKSIQIIFILVLSTSLFANSEEGSWFEKGRAFSVLHKDKIVNCNYFAGGNTSVRAIDLTFQFINLNDYENIKTVRVNFFKELEKLSIPSKDFQVLKKEIINVLPKGKFLGNDLVFFIKNKIFKLTFKEDNPALITLIYESNNVIYDIHINEKNIYSIDIKGVQKISNNKTLVKWPNQNWSPTEFNVEINNKEQLGVLSLKGSEKGNEVYKSILFDLNDNKVIKSSDNRNSIAIINEELSLDYVNRNIISDIKVENFKTSKIISQNSTITNYTKISKIVVCDNRFIAIEVAKNIHIIDIISGELKKTIKFDKENNLAGFIYPKLYFASKSISLEELFKVDIDKKEPELFVNGFSKKNTNTTSDSFVRIEGSFVDDSDIKSITINNKNVKFDALNGSFSFTSELRDGQNDFIISGTDIFNNKHSETIIIQREEIVASVRGTSQESASIEKKITDFNYKALLISNANYRNDVADLDFPIADAEKLGNVLLEDYNFAKEDIIHLKDATRSNIINTLDSLASKITSKDNLLIFYAGHGVFDENLNKGYWIPVDATVDKKDNWVSNSDITDYIAAIKSQHTLLISDACFSGSIFEYKNRDLNPRGQAITDKLINKKSRKAMTSGLNKTVPDVSIFIKYLIKSLRENKKPYLRAGELYNDLREAVMANTDNNPQFEVIKNANHEGGEFIFLKKN